MIYIVPNLVTNISTQFCPDQATIDAGKAKGFPGEYLIGTEAEAVALLEKNRQEYLPKIASLFTATKDINPDPIDTTWVDCDLASEPENTNVDYNVFNPADGTYYLVTGLDNAKALLEQIKQAYLLWCMNITALDTWPAKRRRVVN